MLALAHPALDKKSGSNNVLHGNSRRKSCLGTQNGTGIEHFQLRDHPSPMSSVIKPEGFLLKLFTWVYLALPDMGEHTSAEFGI